MFPDDVVLTLDLGTTVTKAALWGDDGFVALGRAGLTTTHPGPDRAEQDPTAWWTSLVDACAAVRAAAPRAYAAVTALGFSAARQTLVPTTAAGVPLGPALLWSDRRATAEAVALAGAAGGADAVRLRTGLPLNGGAVAAKAAWLWVHDHDRMAATRWLLAPRDLMVWRLCGVVTTDVTMASATGLYERAGQPALALPGGLVDRLPPAVAPTAVAGDLGTAAATELGLRPGLPVVIGAGDRQCEAIGAGGSRQRPVVSWGTTANVSMPVDEWPDPVPDGIAVTRSATGGWLLEGGLSAAGSLIAWLATVTGTEGDELLRAAAARPPGARGVVAVPWLGGARAPWWRDGTGAAFVGLGPAHDRGDLARAAVESVAWDVARCLEAMAVEEQPTATTLAGGGAGAPIWVEVITAVTGLPGVRRRWDEVASAGAAVLVARALGRDLDIDQLNPVAAEVAPSAAAVDCYRRLRPTADRVAGALLELPG